jgi:hypothetical protein
VIIPSARRTLVAATAIAGAMGGAFVALRYHRLGLTLSHYDARGHLVVARRIADSITPGWQQIGAIWLPLPHLLNAIPVQIDLFYRSGASAVAISIVAFAIATMSIAWIVASLTDSSLAAVAAAAVFALNPNVLYLQSTPMTEPLLLALVLLGVALLIEQATLKGCTTSVGEGGTTSVGEGCTTSVGEGCTTSVGQGCTTSVGQGCTTSVGEGGTTSVGEGCTTSASMALGTRSAGLQACPIGVVFALACLTRYEAWPATVGALAMAVWARWRGGESFDTAVRETMRVAVYPAATILAFLLFSRIVVGQWFVSEGFFVPENKALHDPLLAAKELAWGTRELSSVLLLWVGVAGGAWLMASGVASRRHAAGLIAVALLGMASVPWVAFVKGHPFRIRYMVPLLAVEAIGAGALAGALPSGRRIRTACAIGVLALAMYELRPFDASAPMVAEAQWDRPNGPERAGVTSCLGTPGDGKIMASMGSLAHYMQETSRAGFRLRDFLHEGNGDLWLAALDGPRPFAKRILIEEKAQGGDVLAQRARERPHFLDGYTRVCEGAGLALYQRAEGLGLKAKGAGSQPSALSPQP